MGKPILYYATLSPPSRSVLLTAKAIGLELELRATSLFKGEHLTPEFVKMNPQHTIPLLDDNGVHIFDSHAICAYLIDKYAKDDKLYPKDLVKRAAVEGRLYFDAGYLFARLRFLYEPILYYGSPDFPEDKVEYIHKALDIMEAFLKDSPYVCGENLTVADFCCVASISSLEGSAGPVAARHPKLLAWINRLAQLPYYQEVNQAGADELKEIVREKLAANRANA
ncbi:unnamed protein product [Hermetia illucens]|uniref:Glutathione S-transferase 1 n=2 Tax=Hermetia illucens TaxID=343691 RepID=A0A7R8UBJ6_HERIL|nr:glutathione S-transferase 1 isoform X2 [Hermetia illucens]CAD7077521.1 unnamed protein product [Hermetia illucens]